MSPRTNEMTMRGMKFDGSAFDILSIEIIFYARFSSRNQLQCN